MFFKVYIFAKPLNNRRGRWQAKNIVFLSAKSCCYYFISILVIFYIVSSYIILINRKSKTSRLTNSFLQVNIRIEEITNFQMFLDLQEDLAFYLKNGW